jgi:sigma-E factor negative regulatory protein RseA
MVGDHPMKTKISALVDGELDSRELNTVMDALEGDDVPRETWRLYHLLSDAMRDTALRSAGFSTRFAEKLAAEPTVLAPGRLPAERGRWMALSAAASVAAVALVGWLAFAPAPDTTPGVLPGAPLASAPMAARVHPASTEGVRPVMRQTLEPRRGSAPLPMRVLLPEATNDYLLAHQEFSPRSSLQGMAPYVRTVSSPIVEGMRR